MTVERRKERHLAEQKDEIRAGRENRVNNNIMKALLSALQDIEKNGKMPENDKSMSDKVEAFTYGALGMEHPNKIKEEDDSSYSAGQYLSAAATVGSLLLLLV